jgi:hypothetical protein
MTHPFLQDPENLRAFQQLTAVPMGSVRKWEQLLGWKPGRMQRYLANLVQYELAEVESCRQHSVFRPRQSVVDCSVVSRGVAPSNQGNCSGLTAPRLPRKPRTTQKPEEQPGTELLIDAMNRSMRRFDSYLPVRANNFGSHRAARRWLVEKQIPLEEAIAILYKKAEAFDLQKSPGGKYPFSIAYFTRAVLAEWRRIQRDRHQLKLFPKLELQVQRVPQHKPEPDGPTAKPETIDAVAHDWRAMASSPTRPRRP